MKVVKYFSFVALLILAGLLCFYGYMGGFKSVQVSKAQLQQTEIIYDLHRGPYDGLKQSWLSFVAKLEAAGIEDCHALGVFLDPPDTSPEKIRSIIACSTEGLTEQQIKQFPSFTLPSAVSFQASFPYVNELSFMIGSLKVYPEFQKLIATNQIKPSVSIELYGPDKNRSQIQFFMPAGQDPSAYQTLYDAFQ